MMKVTVAYLKQLLAKSLLITFGIGFVMLCCIAAWVAGQSPW